MGGEASIEAGGQAPVHAGFEGSPIVLVVCGPSGAGKSTLIDLLMEENEGFGFSVSHTTRDPRGDEQNGIHYFFTAKEKFETGIAEGRFLEYASVHSNFYGSSKDAVNAVLNSNKCCILDIDVQGARQVRQSGVSAIFVFIAPPSNEELEKRLRARGTDSDEQIEQRLRAAKNEIDSLREPGLFDFCVVNGDLSEAYTQLKTIALNARAGRMPQAQEVRALFQQRSPKSPLPNGAVAQNGSPRGSPKASPRSMARGNQPFSSMEKWRGRVAMVTGASSGIGWATCEALAMAGMRVVAVARRRERLEKLQQALMDKGVPAKDFLPIVCDTSKEVEVSALPRIVAKRWPETPGVDVLVNNASVSKENGSLLDGSTDSWMEMIGANVLGVSMCSREIIKSMKERDEWGHIINISSLSKNRASQLDVAGGGFYTATKTTVKAVTEGLRCELIIAAPLGTSIPNHIKQAQMIVRDVPSPVTLYMSKERTCKVSFKSAICLPACVWLEDGCNIDTSVLGLPFMKELNICNAELQGYQNLHSFV